MSVLVLLEGMGWQGKKKGGGKDKALSRKRTTGKRSQNRSELLHRHLTPRKQKKNHRIQRDL